MYKLKKKLILFKYLMTEGTKSFDFISSDYDKYNSRKYLEDNIYYVEPSIIVCANDFQGNENVDQDTFGIANVVAAIFPYHADSSNSNDESLNDENLCDENTSKNKKPIFKAKKMTNRGRRKLGSNHTKKARHNEFSSDNIIRKVKTLFINSVMKYINKQYNLSTKSRKNGNWLKKIVPLFQGATKKDNPKFFQKKVREILSVDLSNKCTQYQPDYNKKQIDLLFEKKEAINLIEILNKNLGDLYNDYLFGNISGFSLEGDLKILKEKKGKEYIERVNKSIKDLIYISKS
jgi:hypothetical protein